MSSETSSRNKVSHLLDRALARPSSSPSHPLETTLLIVSGLYLSLMPWAFGAMYVWTQKISLGFAAVAFVIALFPRTYRDENTDKEVFRMRMWTKLLKFPMFWIGLVFLAYILVQALNPAWNLLQMSYLSNGRPREVTWLQPLRYVEWLPSSIKTPMGDYQMPPWRILMIYGSAWLLVCALWVGLTRRKSIRTLLTVLAVNGTLFALIGIIQRASGSSDMLWYFAPPKYVVHFFSTIIYKNHAGAYINLIITLSTVLMVYHMLDKDHIRGRARPTPIFALFIVALVLGLYLTQSRGAVIVFGTYFLITVLFLLGVLVKRSLENGPSVLIISAVLCVGMIGVLVFGAKTLEFERYYKRYAELWNKDMDENISWRLREKANEVTWEMAKDNIVTGWGAGSFRYIFSKYARTDKQLVGTPGQRHHRWEYAHNDYIQFLAEYGIIGSSIALLAFLWWIGYLFYRQFFRYPYLILLVIGLFGLMAHCIVDFQTHNPAILLLACTMATIACLWAKLNDKERKAYIEDFRK